MRYTNRRILHFTLLMILALDCITHQQLSSTVHLALHTSSAAWRKRRRRSSWIYKLFAVSWLSDNE